MTRMTLFLTVLVACGGQQRELTGVAPEGADAIYAVGRDGSRVDAELDGSSFRVDLPPGIGVELVVVAGGTEYPLIFPANLDATAWQSNIPDFGGTIDLGQLSTVDATMLRGAEDEDHAESEENPLDEIDSDDDGEDDLEDDDDDDDGVDDDDDDDDDGDGEDDDDDDEDDETETESEDETETETE